jgi:hypothetical protein
VLKNKLCEKIRILCQHYGFQQSIIFFLKRELPSTELMAAIDTEGNFVTYKVVEERLVYLRNTLNKFARTDSTTPASCWVCEQVQSLWLLRTPKSYSLSTVHYTYSILCQVPNILSKAPAEIMCGFRTSDTMCTRHMPLATIRTYQNRNAYKNC